MKSLAIPTISSIAIAFLFTAPVIASDDCIIGTWEPDYHAFSEQYLDITGADGVSMIGEALMAIHDYETGTYILNNLTFEIENADQPRTDIIISGTGDFTISMMDGGFSLEMGEFDYDAQAKIYIGNDPMVMDIPFTEEMAPMGGGAIGTYECSTTELIFTPSTNDGRTAPNMIKIWKRVE